MSSVTTSSSIEQLRGLVSSLVAQRFSFSSLEAEMRMTAMTTVTTSRQHRVAQRFSQQLSSIKIQSVAQQPRALVSSICDNLKIRAQTSASSSIEQHRGLVSSLVAQRFSQQLRGSRGRGLQARAPALQDQSVESTLPSTVEWTPQTGLQSLSSQRQTLK